MQHSGSCHCGAIGVTYESTIPPGETQVRACQCGFCRRHGARAVSDPQGRLTIEAEAALLNRYRFGLGTADFLLCHRCGAYVASVMQEGDTFRGIINVNVLDDAEAFSRQPEPVVYDSEDEAARRARRRARWTPALLRFV